MAEHEAEHPPAAADANVSGPPDAPLAPDIPDDLALARDLVLRAHPEAVPELVTGVTLAELLASVPAAEAAYTRIAETVRVGGTSVPGGGAVRSTGVNIDGLGPLAKIRAGLSKA